MKMVNCKRCVFVVLLVFVSVTCQDEDKDAEGKVDDERIPVSEHEFPKENIPTKPNYKGEGHWATPAPDSGIDLGFIPIKMYSQVRRSISVKHLPRSDALASATTAEEIANAPRLREVIGTKKISEVYTEEGYEDSAYDHGGYAKEAENHEEYDNQDKAKHKKKPKRKKVRGDKSDSESQGSDSEVKKVGAPENEPRITWQRHKVTTNETKLMFVDDQGEEAAPMKLSASYSHTIQHPGTSETKESQKQEIITVSPEYPHSLQQSSPLNENQSELQETIADSKLTNEWQPIGQPFLPAVANIYLPGVPISHQIPPIFYSSASHMNVPIQYENQESIPSLYEPSVHLNLPLLPQNQHTVPIFFNPVPTSHPGSGSKIATYDQLKQQLYGSPLSELTATQEQEHVHIGTEESQQEPTQDTNTFSETKLSIKKVNPEHRDNYTNNPNNIDGISIAKTLSLLRNTNKRGHNNKPIEQIKAHFEIVDGPSVESTGIKKDTLRLGQSITQPSQDEKAVISSTPVVEKMKSYKYTSKYRNTDSSRERIDSDKSHNENLKNYRTINSPIFDEALSSSWRPGNQSALLPLWAKFVETLTLEQYAKDGKILNTPSNHGENNTKLKTYRNVPGIILKRKSDLVKIVKALDNATANDNKNEQKHFIVGIVSMNSEKVSEKNKIDLETLNNRMDNKEFMASSKKVSRRSDDYDNYGNPQYLSGEDEEIRLQEEESLIEKEKDEELQGYENEWKGSLENTASGFTSIQVDSRKYPYYNSLPSSTISVHSPLRYASNPRDIPKKTAGGMEFYESREKIYCPEVNSPQDVVPKRTAEGEWNKNPKPKLPRIKGLGDKIDCMRAKYFGSDPLDNPFFQESTVNVPAEASTDRIDSEQDADAQNFYEDIMEHIRNIGDIRKIPSISEPEPDKINAESTSGHQFIHPTESDEDEYPTGSREFVPQRGQYGYETTAYKTYENPDDPPYSEGNGPHSFEHVNITQGKIRHAYGLLTHDPIYQEDEEDDETPEHKNNEDDETSLPSITEGPQNAEYQPIRNEVIFGMVPPPMPKPSYLIIKTVSRKPASLLSLLSEPAPILMRRPRPRYRTRPIHIALNSYSGSMPGMIPLIAPHNTKSNVLNEPLRGNEIYAASNMMGMLRNMPLYRHSNQFNNQFDFNIDQMVAEESSGSKPVTGIRRRSASIGAKTHPASQEFKQRVRRQTGQYHDIGSTDEKVYGYKNGARRNGLNLHENIKNVDTGIFLRNPKAINNPNRYNDYAQDEEYSRDELSREQVRNENHRMNHRKKKITAMSNIGGDSREYATTVQYKIRHDGPERIHPLNASDENKYGHINQQPSENNSRRGEPTYENKDEQRKQYKPSQTHEENEKQKNETINTSKPDSLSENRRRTSAPVRNRNKMALNLKRTCNSDTDCIGIMKKIGSDHMQTKEKRSVRQKDSPKKTLIGFVPSPMPVSDINTEEHIPAELMEKMKLKYPEGVMSAAEINKLLGGLMSRHNPAYSSKYSADDPNLSTLKRKVKYTESGSDFSRRRNSDIRKPRINLVSTINIVPGLLRNSENFHGNPSVNKPEIYSSESETTQRGTFPDNRKRMVRTEKTSGTELNNVDQGNLSIRNVSSSKDNNNRQEKIRSRDRESQRIKTGENVQVKANNKDGKEERRHENSNDIRSSVNTKPKSATIHSQQRRNKHGNIKSEPETSREPLLVHMNLPTNSNSTEKSTDATPRRLQAIEHRRVTKEEIIKRTYYPQEQLARVLEKQSQADASELEEANISNEKIIRNIREGGDENDDDDDNDDDSNKSDVEKVSYEPYESYGPGSQLVSYPVKRLETRLSQTQGLNGERGHSIHLDAIPGNPVSSNREYGSNTGEEESFYSRRPVTFTPQNADDFVEKSGNTEGKANIASELKSITKSAVKGFYNQNSPERTLPVYPITEDAGYNNTSERSRADVLTYLEDSKDGNGGWIPIIDGKSFIETSTAVLEGSPSEELKDPAWMNVREYYKRPKNNSIPSSRNKVIDRKIVHKQDEIKNMSAVNTGNTEAYVSPRFVKVPTKKDNKRRIIDKESGKRKLEETKKEGSLNARNKNMRSTLQPVNLHTHRPKETTGTETGSSETGKEATDVRKDRIGKENDSDYYEFLNYDDYELRYPKSGDISFKIRRGKHSEGSVIKEKRLPMNAKPGDSPLNYNSEIPESSNTPEREKYEPASSAESTEDGENYEEAIASIYSKILTEVPLGYRNNFADTTKSQAGKNVKFIKHPGQRRYFYVNDSPFESQKNHEKISSNRRRTFNSKQGRDDENDE